MPDNELANEEGRDFVALLRARLPSSVREDLANWVDQNSDLGTSEKSELIEAVNQMSSEMPQLCHQAGISYPSGLLPDTQRQIEEIRRVLKLSYLEAGPQRLKAE